MAQVFGCLLFLLLAGCVVVFNVGGWEALSILILILSALIACKLGSDAANPDPLPGYKEEPEDRAWHNTLAKRFYTAAALMIVACVGIVAWMLWSVEANKQSAAGLFEAAESLKDYGFEAEVSPDSGYGRPAGPTLLRSWLGDPGTEFRSFVVADSPNINDRTLSDVVPILHKLPGLKLDLSNSLVTDQGLPHLMKLENLKQIDLKQTQVTAEGIEKLKDALPSCHWL